MFTYGSVKGAMVVITRKTQDVRAIMFHVMTVFNIIVLTKKNPDITKNTLQHHFSFWEWLKMIILAIYDSKDMETSMSQWVLHKVIPATDPQIHV